MKKCRKCGKEFPSRQVIDGKVRNLYKRAFCTDCSPFGAGNSKKYLGIVYGSCELCGKQFQKGNKNEHVGDKCSSCWSREYKKARMEKARQFLGGKCCLCGYDKCKSALEFHHTDGETKEFGISNKINCSWDKILEELKKCVLVCSNCHREIHEGLIDVETLLQMRVKLSR